MRWKKKKPARKSSAECSICRWRRYIALGADAHCVRQRHAILFRGRYGAGAKKHFRLVGRRSRTLRSPCRAANMLDQLRCVVEINHQPPPGAQAPAPLGRTVQQHRFFRRAGVEFHSFGRQMGDDQFRRRAAADNCSRRHNRHLIAEPLRFVHVLWSQHRRPLAAHSRIRDQCARRTAGRVLVRFVKDQQARPLIIESGQSPDSVKSARLAGHRHVCVVARPKIDQLFGGRRQLRLAQRL